MHGGVNHVKLQKHIVLYSMPMSIYYDLILKSAFDLRKIILCCRVFREIHSVSKRNFKKKY